MNTIEQELWEYIDGQLNADEHVGITKKIAEDPEYQSIYNNLLLINSAFDDLELEEPSLSFTRNVMEEIKEIPAPVTLKTKIDKRIIYTIGSLFVAAIIGIFIYAIAITKTDFEMPTLHLESFTSKLTNPTFLIIFVLLDVMLGLVYLDGLLRRKNRKAWESKSPEG